MVSTHLKNISKIGSFPPSRGENKKHLIMIDWVLPRPFNTVTVDSLFRFSSFAQLCWLHYAALQQIQSYSATTSGVNRVSFIKINTVYRLFYVLATPNVEILSK